MSSKSPEKDGHGAGYRAHTEVRSRGFLAADVGVGRATETALSSFVPFFAGLLAVEASAADATSARATTSQTDPIFLKVIVSQSVLCPGSRQVQPQSAPSFWPFGKVADLSAPPALPLRSGNMTTSILSPALTLLNLHPLEVKAEGLEHSSP